METLDEVLRKLKGLQSALFRQVLLSYAFSLVGVLMTKGKFDLAFKALIELVAGTLGAAGILSSYLAAVSHPSDEFRDLLGFNPFFAGIKVVFGLGVSAALFYSFYLCAQLEYKISALLLAVGMFFFFRTMTSMVLTISKVERQKTLWQSLAPESQRAWLEAREEAHNLLKEAQATGEEAKQIVDSTLKEVRKIMWQNKLLRIRHFFRNLWARAYPLRKRLRLVPWYEEHELNQAWAEILAEIKNKAVQKVRQGEVRPLGLEGTDLKFFEVDECKYLLLEGCINEENARRCLSNLAKLRSKPGEPFRNITAIIEPSAQLTFEARELLSKEGLELIEPRSPDNPGNPVAAAAAPR